ncbi:anti-phage deoxyguanosine triphosphatase [Alkalimonas delamerensis]|uniref:Deoxyguanosinetriphosphate triphosphohydrolase-like protein n=1 Tax=Alkalimonas delamerensis TaxID=265981 RepID=A0ABT9GPM9_9GAMM|nr:anti-phage deoxyguanosine triphosphatase [Alkalimonas delamerensis]MDP4528611.1 anti-phage deoxyguanosine triphosphatase [Alkalimonas delamerensis]
MWESRRSHPPQHDESSYDAIPGDATGQRDRARIIHSEAFRRLQSKTQVLGVGEHDFYRTRLTHSLEVAQLGSGICEKLRQRYRENTELLSWLPGMGQIEAICLAHDLGHPPFGHGGEVALNYFMHDQGGFEGNGQTLRILAHLGEYSPQHGLDLSRRTMLGVLKYPVLHREVACYPVELAEGTSNIDSFKPPKCIHDEDEAVLNWILAPLPAADQELFRSSTDGSSHRKARYQGLDTSIMELADDIAYGVHDLEDALALKLVTEHAWREQVLARLPADDVIAQNADFYSRKLFSESSCERKHAISKLVHSMLTEISVRAQGRFRTPLLDYQAQISVQAKQTLAVLKDFVYQQVIKSPEVQSLEYKGQQLILKLFRVLRDNPKRLLPPAVLARYQEAAEKDRVICDYLATLTDHHAVRLYHKLFSPDMGSVFDRI